MGSKPTRPTTDIIIINKGGLVLELTRYVPRVKQTLTLSKIKNFVVKVFKRTREKIVDFFVGFYRHFESVSLLTLSSFGLSALLGELPFWLTLPWWIEAPMVIPFISICIVLMLIKMGETRAKRRIAVA